MSNITSSIYDLLPAVIRIRDAERGEPLRKLFDAFEAEASLVERDIDQLYDNSFIETCEEWAVPYIGDLLGITGLHPVSDQTFSNRARVANTLGYRRRKGTASMLEQLARDTTGWHASVTELFQLLGWNQHGQHLRPSALRTPDIHDPEPLEKINAPFDGVCTTVDVHGMDLGRRSENIHNIAIFLWRLVAYPMQRSQARFVGGTNPGRFTFNPLGKPIHLFNQPSTESGLNHLVVEREVPAPLRRLPLYRELEQASSPENGAFGLNPVIQVWIADAAQPVPRSEIAICDLTKWRRPKTARVAVDPVLGRIALRQGLNAARVYVSYSYGFSGDMGSGPYSREETVRGEPLPTWQLGVQQRNRPGGSPDVETLVAAVPLWNAQPPNTRGRIVMTDSETFDGGIVGPDKIVVEVGSDLTILAAGWPFPNLEDGDLSREVEDLVVSGVRPHIHGHLEVTGRSNSALTLNGLLIEGRLTVTPGDLSHLAIRHCTLAPQGAAGRLAVKMGAVPNRRNDALQVTIERSVLRSIELPESVDKMEIKDSIITEDVIALGAELTLRGCTILGEVQAKTIYADNCIFGKPLLIERLQEGCVRFCFVPVGSLCPRRYRCQPSLALTGVLEGAPEEAEIIGNLRPLFTSTQHPHHAFCQLHRDCPVEIRTGADDGSEMGAFSFLKQPQREANLRASVDEYLRFGLEAGPIFVT